MKPGAGCALGLSHGVLDLMIFGEQFDVFLAQMMNDLPFFHRYFVFIAALIHCVGLLILSVKPIKCA